MQEFKDQDNIELRSSTDDTDLKINFKNTSNFSKLKTASLIAAPLSLYQMILSLQNLQYLPQGYGSSQVVSSLLIFLSSLAIYLWTSQIIHDKSQILKPFAINFSDSQTYSRLIFVGSIIQIAFASYILAGEHLYAQYAEDAREASGATGNLSSTIRFSSLIAQAFMIGYLSLAAISSFKLLSDDDVVISQLISTSNLAMVFAAIGVCSTASSASSVLQDDDVASSVSGTLLTLLYGSGISLLILGFGTWFANHGKWRVGFLTSSIALLIILIITVLGTNALDSEANDVHFRYWNVGDKDHWSTFMGKTAESALQMAGCPNKYLGHNNCPKYLRSKVWEHDLSLIEEKTQCLNTDCSGALGQVYATPFKSIISFAMLATIFGGINLIGMLYFIKQKFPTRSDKKSKSHYIFWGLMTLAVVGYAYSEVVGSSAPGIEQYPGNSKQLGLQNLYATNPFLEKLSFAPSLFDEMDLDGMDEELQELMVDFFIFKEYKYVIFQAPSAGGQYPEAKAKGWMNSFTFDDFKADFEDLDIGIGLCWIQVEHVYRLMILLAERQDLSDRGDYPSREDMEDDLDDPMVFIETEYLENFENFRINDIIYKNRNKFALQEFEMLPSDEYDPVIFPSTYESTSFSHSASLAVEVSSDLEDAFDEYYSTFNLKWVIGSPGNELELVSTGESRENLIDFAMNLPTQKFSFVVYNFQYEEERVDLFIFANLDRAAGSQSEAVKELIEGSEEARMPALSIHISDDFDLPDLIAIAAYPENYQDTYAPIHEEIRGLGLY